MKKLLAIILSFGISTAAAHPPDGGAATYLANEAVMVSDHGKKILFDPLFDLASGPYLNVPPEMRAAMMSGAAPFDHVDAVFISHAHDDHFSADAVIDYLLANKNVKLIAPGQAADGLYAAEAWDEALAARLTVVDLAQGDAPMRFTLGDIEIFAVRIPHSGQRSRATVQNIVYRVTLGEGATVMHLGDADKIAADFAPYKDDFAARASDMGFPPFWFFGDGTGEAILKDQLYINHPVGIHVPANVPGFLIETGADYFSTPGETRPLHKPQ